MVTVTIEGTPLQVREAMLTFIGASVPQQTVTIDVNKELPKSLAKADKADVAAKEAAKEAVKETVKDTSVAGVAPSAQTIADYIPKLAKKVGKPVVVALLAKYNAKKGGDLKEADYAAFLADGREAEAKIPA